MKIRLALKNVCYLILFTICAKSFSQEIRISEKPISFRPDKTQKGLVFGSFTLPQEKAPYLGYYFKVECVSPDKKIARKNSAQILINTEDDYSGKHVGPLDSGLTYLFTKELNEGDYVISVLRTTKLYRMTLIDFFFRGFSIPFSVKKGEITYLGNIFFDDSTEVKDIQRISYQNNFERDLKAIKIFQPYVYWKDAKNEPINFTTGIKE